MSTAQLKYRPEIDGLRALAVLAVILFHGRVPGFSGGFVGVDVFFVISGYLITSILLRELRQGQFSITDFYERRIRRILPALLLVLVASTAAGWFLQDPFGFARLGQSLMATTAFVSNILFWRTTNYFTAALDNPLLHTWSLGVEEQFYLFFPIALWSVWRYAPKWLTGCLMGSLLISLLASQWGVESGRALAAFYLLPTRCFELLMGAMAATLPIASHLDKRPAVGRALGLTGLAAIGVAIAAFDQSTPFPGIYAMVPAIGSVLVLVAASQANVVGRMLAWPPLVAVGLISYSAYLWHQPVFTYAHLAGMPDGLTATAALILGSLLLAYFSWRCVEQPFRDRMSFSRHSIFGMAALGSALVFAAGAALWATHGVTQRFSPAEMKWWDYVDLDVQSKYVTERFYSLSGPFDDTSARKILLLGDSQAQDFMNMAYEAAAWQDAQVRTGYIPTSCQPVWTDHDLDAYISPANRHKCRHALSLSQARQQMDEADVVIIAAGWKTWSATLLPETLGRLQLRAEQQLYVIGPKRFPLPDMWRLLAMDATERANLRYELDPQRLEVNEAVRKATARFGTFIDVIGQICGAAAQCPWVTPHDALISYDGGHLTQPGAAYLGKVLFEESPLQAIR